MALTLQYQIVDVTASGAEVRLDVRLNDKATAKEVGQAYVAVDLAAIADIKVGPGTTAEKAAAIKALIQAAVADQTVKLRESLLAQTDLSPFKNLTWDAV